MTQLHRKLSARHLSMIALGGTLGTGIFLTSGSALHVAGSGGAILAYLLMGVMVYFLMTSLGEMSAYHPVSGSFCEYASLYVGKSFGFAMGYNYWFNWAITIAVELIAAAIVMGYWFPVVPPIEWCVLFFLVIFGLNILSVKSYGESQYWLSLLKVLTVILFILASIWIVSNQFYAEGNVDLDNWLSGSFRGGSLGLFQVFLLSGFAFQGTELVGVAAGEAADPTRSIPRAIKQIFWRILLFYVLVMLMISLIIPSSDPRLLNTKDDVALSPFTIIFSLLHIPYVAGIMNFIILTALLSACNSDLYSATRILWHLSNKGSAPAVFSKVTQSGVPLFALLVTAVFGAAAFLCYFLGGNSFFLLLVNMSSLSGFIAWYGIARSHLGFRKHYIRDKNKLEDLPFRARFYPWAPIIAIVLCAVVIFGQWYTLMVSHIMSLSAIMSMYSGLLSVFLLWIGNRWYRSRKKFRNTRA